MSIAALITWVITAGIGAFMLARWLNHGGLRAGGAATHFPPARVFSHFVLAAAGLIVWIVYLAIDRPLLAWIAFADLVLVALLGGVLVARWTKDGRARSAGADAELDLAEQHIPRAPVVMHGVFAVSTLLLVLFSALGIAEN
jgi:hypothetical protein